MCMYEDGFYLYIIIYEYEKVFINIVVFSYINFLDNQVYLVFF